MVNIPPFPIPARLSCQVITEVSVSHRIYEDQQGNVLGVLRSLGALQVFLVDEVIDCLLDVRNFGCELGRDSRCHLLDQGLMFHGLNYISTASPSFWSTRLSSLHQAHDCRLVDELAVLINRLEYLRCLGFLLRSDGTVEIDADLGPNQSDMSIGSGRLAYGFRFEVW